jgi:hypothetical protein
MLPRSIRKRPRPRKQRIEALIRALLSARAPNLRQLRRLQKFFLRISRLVQTIRCEQHRITRLQLIGIFLVVHSRKNPRRYFPLAQFRAPPLDASSGYGNPAFRKFQLQTFRNKRCIQSRAISPRHWPHSNRLFNVISTFAATHDLCIPRSAPITSAAYIAAGNPFPTTSPT